MISLEVLAQDSAVVIKTNRELEITREKTKIKKKTVLSLCKSFESPCFKSCVLIPMLLVHKTY